VKDGPAAAWEQIKTELSELKDQLIGQITQMITTEVVKAAVIKLVSMLNPAGAVVQAILAIYNTITFFIQKINQIAAVVASFIDSIAAIAAGQISSAAKKVEQTMARTLTVIIAFLAKFAGLGNIPEKVVGIIKKIRQPIDKGLDKIVTWLGNMLKKLVSSVAQAGLPKDPEKRAEMGLSAAVQVVNALNVTDLSEALINPALQAVKVRYGFKTLKALEVEGTWWVEGSMSPPKKKKTNKSKDGITKIEVKRSKFSLSTKWTLAELIPGEHRAAVKGRGPRLKKQLDRRHVVSSQSMAAHYNSVLNGLKWSQAKEKLDPKSPVGTPLGNKTIQTAAQALHTKFFNDVENLFIGDASENRSIGAEKDIPQDWVEQEWRKHLRYIKTNYALDNTFTP
jgi:hypothetical protein